MNSLIRDALHEAWAIGKSSAGEHGWANYVWTVKLFFTKFSPMASGWRTKFDA
jgi:hypothetical protein